MHGLLELTVTFTNGPTKIMTNIGKKIILENNTKQGFLSTKRNTYPFLPSLYKRTPEKNVKTKARQSFYNGNTKGEKTKRQTQYTTECNKTKQK